MIKKTALEVFELLLDSDWKVVWFFEHEIIKHKTGYFYFPNHGGISCLRIDADGDFACEAHKLSFLTWLWLGPFGWYRAWRTRCSK